MRCAGMFQTLTPGEMRQWMDSEREFVLIDSLPGEHFDKRHLPGARNACIYEVSFLQQVADLVPDRGKTIVICGADHLTRDAETAAAKLLQAGFVSVYVLKGGIEGWALAGYPLEGTEPHTTENHRFLRLIEGEYRADPEESVIHWTGRNPKGKHHGTVNLSGGTLHIHTGRVEGEFEVDMRSLKNVDLEGDPLQPVLMAHLFSDDFFLVDAFPSARFTITQGNPAESPLLSSPNLDITGSLEMHGVVAPLQFRATFNHLPDGTLTAEAHFDLDRTRWGVIYGSSRYFDHLGMHLVFDLITIEIRLVARRTP